jgi:hypothetical protein
MLTLTSADSAEEFTMKGKHPIAFQANGGTLQIKIKVEDGVFVNLGEQVNQDYATVGDFGNAILKFEITGGGKMAYYGGFYA